MIERRFVKGLTLRADVDGNKIGGYASVFNEQYDAGWFIETIMPGAFTRALEQRQDVRCLFNHDPNQILGRTKAGTLSLTQDAKGLQYEATLPDTQLGKDVRISIDRGDVDGSSFAFRVIKESWREETNPQTKKTTEYRKIEDLDLFDVSPVTYPAYEGTSVGIRALFPEGVPAEVRSHVQQIQEDLPILNPPPPPPLDLQPLLEAANARIKELQAELQAAKQHHAESRAVQLNWMQRVAAELQQANKSYTAAVEEISRRVRMESL